MATVRKRGPYQWKARIRKKGYPTTCKIFETKFDAEAWTKEVETKMNKSLFVSAKEAEQYTLSECLDRYIEEYIPRLKHAKREEDRAKALQRRPIAHRIMAIIRARILPSFVVSVKPKERAATPSALISLCCPSCSTMLVPIGAWKASLIPLSLPPNPNPPKAESVD